MKTVCPRHYQAYEVSQGCPWCEPAPAVAKASSGIRPMASRQDLYDLHSEGEAFLQLMCEGQPVRDPSRAVPTWMPDPSTPKVLVQYKFHFAAGPQVRVDSMTLYDRKGYQVSSQTFSPIIIPITATFDITYDLNYGL